MKKKILFLLCTILMGLSTVYAEENYKTVCKNKKENELINCCNNFVESKKECKTQYYKTCLKGNTLNDKYECCNKLSDEDEQYLCRNYVTTTCSNKDLSELSKAAMRIRVTYEPVEIKHPDNSSLSFYMLDIKVYNLIPELDVYVTNKNGNTFMIEKEKIKNGMITIRSEDTTEISKYTFRVESNESCQGKILRTMNLTLPKYNQYSQREVCEEIPTYYLCQEYINFEIDDAKFLNSVTTYKERISKKEIKNNDDSNETVNNPINKTFNIVSDGKYLLVALILIVGILFTFMIIKKTNGKEDKYE